MVQLVARLPGRHEVVVSHHDDASDFSENTPVLVYNDFYLEFSIASKHNFSNFIFTCIDSGAWFKFSTLDILSAYTWCSICFKHT